MRKEQRFWKQAAENARLQREKTLGKDASKPRIIEKYQSSTLNALDQSIGLVRNPHTVISGERPPASEMLLHGVSHMGEGKKAYLHHRTKSGGPHERYGRAVTSAQEIGWTSKMVTTHQASPFAQRSAIKNEFYRVNGAHSCLALP